MTNALTVNSELSHVDIANLAARDGFLENLSDGSAHVIGQVSGVWKGYTFLAYSSAYRWEEVHTSESFADAIRFQVIQTALTEYASHYDNEREPFAFDRHALLTAFD